MRLPLARGLVNSSLLYKTQCSPSLLPATLKSGDAAAGLIARKWARQAPNLTRCHRRSLHDDAKEPNTPRKAVSAGAGGLPQQFRDFKDYCT